LGVFLSSFFHASILFFSPVAGSAVSQRLAITEVGRMRSTAS
jgi:hypothetical protein